MKLSVSVPDHLWEAAGLATLLLDDSLPANRPPTTSLVVQRSLQVLVATAWQTQPEAMDEWIEKVKERIGVGISQLAKGHGKGTEPAKQAQTHRRRTQSPKPHSSPPSPHTRPRKG